MKYFFVCDTLYANAIRYPKSFMSLKSRLLLMSLAIKGSRMPLSIKVNPPPYSYKMASRVMLCRQKQRWWDGMGDIGCTIKPFLFVATTFLKSDKWKQLYKNARLFTTLHDEKYGFEACIRF